MHVHIAYNSKKETSKHLRGAVSDQPVLANPKRHFQLLLSLCIFPHLSKTTLAQILIPRRLIREGNLRKCPFSRVASYI